jgi:hypothetical protein
LLRCLFALCARKQERRHLFGEPSPVRITLCGRLQVPFASSDGANLYVESTGTGTPIVFVHEFAGDYRNGKPSSFLPGGSAVSRSTPGAIPV